MIFFYTKDHLQTNNNCFPVVIFKMAVIKLLFKNYLLKLSELYPHEKLKICLSDSEEINTLLNKMSSSICDFNVESRQNLAVFQCMF